MSDARPVSVLQFSAAFGAGALLLREACFERTVRQGHLRAQDQGFGWHAHFKFEHCPEEICRKARGEISRDYPDGREPGEDG